MPEKIEGVPYPLYVDGPGKVPLARRFAFRMQKRIFGGYAGHYCDHPDNRQLVNPVWKAICELEVTYSSSSKARATGFLISSRVVMTAAHVVESPEGLGTATLIIVRPGRHSSDAPSLEQSAHRYEKCLNWNAASPNGEWDYAAIILDDPEKFADIRPFRFRALANGDMGQFEGQGRRWALAGYPADSVCDQAKPEGYQWWDAGKTIPESRNARTFQYTMCTSAGQSGSPVFLVEDDQPVAIGIHSNGLNQKKMARRIDGELAHQMEEWSTAFVS